MQPRILEGFKRIEGRFPTDARARLLSRARDHEPFAFLDGHHYPDPFGSFEWLAAWEGDPLPVNDLKGLYTAWRTDPSWLFGYLSYDIKNQIEDLTSSNEDLVGLPELWFFRPMNILVADNDGVWYKGPHTEETVLEWLRSAEPIQPWEGHLALESQVDQEQYLEAVAKLKEHIQRGDIYEVNYCIPFLAEGNVDPYVIFEGLNKIANAPFSAFLSWREGAILSASPERYLAKRGQRLVSQPIKGTAPRSRDPKLDMENARSLVRSVKERAENVMIVDLVRNDLSRVASRGSVSVPELFGVYKYPTVHQMISTITADLREGLSWLDVIQASFPMGSMTGAPKVRAMQLIEKVEIFRRGIYSGAMGYITPDGDMDLNVVIRSIVMNRRTQRLLAGVGSAITTLADPLEEYKECQLKVKAIRQALDPHPGPPSTNG
ncbi:MAG: aminodeoxychorismate synthase component I [Bacteroidota bacterium]|nr:aminodeoxychorismate synthase component I [Bacteroidota bacterium]